MIGQGIFKCFYLVDIVNENNLTLDCGGRSHIRHFPAIIVNGLRGLSLRGSAPMKSFRAAVTAAILTALLAVPAHASHKRFGGFVFVEPFFNLVPERPVRGRWRQQEGYPVALVRQRLRGIGFSGIGQFDVYPSAYGVSAADPGGVRVNLVIDRWSGDIVRARVIEAGSAARPYRPPVVVERVPGARRDAAARRVPPLPRPAPERLTQTAGIAPLAAADRLEPGKRPSPAIEGGDIVTSSINRPDAVPEIDPIGEPVPIPRSLPVTEAEAPPSKPEAPVDVTALPERTAHAEADAVALAPVVASELARPDSIMPDSIMPVSRAPVTALQGERFDPADGRDPITVY